MSYFFSTANSIVILTPRANQSYIGRNLSVIVEYSGRVEQNVMLTFTYAENPHISDIQPRVLSILLVYVIVHVIFHLKAGNFGSMHHILCS